MGKKKNLTPIDAYELGIAEEILEKIHTSQNGNGNGHSNGNGHAKPQFDLSNISFKIKCFNEKQKELRRAIENKEIVISTGPAGTGKTYLSLLTALSLMKKEPDRYRKLVLIKSLQTMPGENPGILPGDLEEKLEPYMYSFYGNLDKIFGLKLIRKELIRREFIEVQCLGFVRGVTIDNAIVIIDEVQNLSVHSFKTILSRIGKNCKMILLGDLEQIDLRNRSESGLKKVMDSLKNNPNIDLIEFSKEEIVRNPIIEGILKDLENI